MGTISFLCMKKVHQITSFVRLKYKLDPLSNQISTGTNSSNSKEDVVGKEIWSQTLQNKFSRFSLAHVQEANMHAFLYVMQKG